MRAYAHVLALNNPKVAADAVTRAEALLTTGALPAVEDKETVAAGATKEWEAAYGGSMNDPEMRDRVYKAAAALRKLELEEAGKLATAREKAQQKKSRRRKLRGP